MSRAPFAWLSLGLLLACTGRVEHGAAGPEGASSPAGGAPAAPAGPPALAGSGGAPASPSCASADDAVGGPVPLRRLTRGQYARTVGALLTPALGAERAAALGESAAARFPADDHAGPFAANATASITEAHARAALESAETVATAVTAADTLPKLLGCAASDLACARGFVPRFAARAFRHALDDETTAALGTVFDSVAQTGDVAAATRASLEAVLQAPDFLYHVERADTPGTDAAAVRLDDFEVAARLSYFLWDGPPDEALFEAARTGALASPGGVRAQAERLLSDDRAQAAVTTFVDGWLNLSSLSGATRDPKLYPTFSPAVAAAMRAETVGFVDAAFRATSGADGSFAALFTANRSVVADALLPIYGVSRPFLQNALVPLELPPAQRAGVLTQAGVLTASSRMDSTSPVKRGVLVLDHLLCYEIPLPDGIKIPPLPDPDPAQTTRQRFAQHEKEPACAACHKVIDPFGLALERYDATGAYREREANQPIDDATSLAVGDFTLDGPVQGGVALAQRIAASGMARACFARQVQRFALRRREGAADSCRVQRLVDTFTSPSATIRELLLATATDEAFRSRPRTTSR